MEKKKKKGNSHEDIKKKPNAGIQTDKQNRPKQRDYLYEHFRSVFPRVGQLVTVFGDKIFRNMRVRIFFIPGHCQISPKQTGIWSQFGHNLVTIWPQLVHN